MRISAARALSQTSDQYAVWGLIHGLGDRDNKVRDCCRDALRLIGIPAVGPLISEIDDGSRLWKTTDVLAHNRHTHMLETLLNAILTDMGDTRAVEELLSLLKRYRIKKTIIHALGSLGDVRVVEPLLSILHNDEDMSVRVAAASALRSIPWDPATVEEQVYHCAIKRKISECIQIGSPAVIPLIQIMQENWGLEVEAMNALADIGGEAAAAAISSVIYQVKTRERHLHAVKALGRLGGEEGIAQLKNALSYPDDAVLEAVVAALGETGDVRAVEPLIKALAFPTLFVGRHGVKALVSIGEPAVLPLIAVLAKDADRHMREWSRSEIAVSPKDFTLASLMWQSVYIDNMRTQAAEALGLIGDVRAVEVLKRACDDKEESVRFLAREALARIQKKQEGL